MADMIHSNQELGDKMETATPSPEAGPSQDELVANSVDMNGGSPTLDGDLHSPERANVNAMREALETQAEMEVGKPISEKQEEVQDADGTPNREKAEGKSVEIDGQPGKQIIINIASEGEQEDKITSGMGGMGGTDLVGPSFEQDYPSAKAAMLKNASLLNEGDLRKLGKEFINRVRTAAISVLQGRDKDGFQMIILMNGKDYVLRGDDAEQFRREYAAIQRPEAKVNALIEKFMWKLQPYKAPLRELPPMPMAEESKPEPPPTKINQEDMPQWLKRKEREESNYSKQKTEPSLTRYSSSYTMRCPSCGGQASKSGHGEPYACQCGWHQKSAKKIAAGDHWGYDDWITGHTDLMIDNEANSHQTKQRLVQNALKRGIGQKQLATQFSRLFNKQYLESKKFYEDNAANARDERGAHERQQLEGGKEPSGDKTKDFVDGLNGLFFDMGGQSSWEEAVPEINWEAIAASALEEGRLEAQNTGMKVKEHDPEFSNSDKKMMESMGIKSSALSAPDRHQLNIAIKTMKMPEEMAGVMGGMTKAEAVIVLARHGYRWDNADYMAGGKGIKKNAFFSPEDAKKFREHNEGSNVALNQDEKGSRKWEPVFPAEPVSQWEIDGSDGYRYVNHEAQLATTGFGSEEGLKRNADIIRRDAGTFKLMRDRYLKMFNVGDTMTEKQAGEGEVKNQAELEKEAGFNFFFPGQVLKEFRPELQHEIVDYPNANNTPMGGASPEITGDGGHDTEGLDAMLEKAFDNLSIVEPVQLQNEDAGDTFELPADVSEVEEVHIGADYSSTSPAGAMGIGRDGKSQVLEGAPLRKENDIRGPMFTDEFYGQYQAVPGKTLTTAGKLAHTNSATEWKTALGTEGDLEQFSAFLKKVCAEIAATLVYAYKATFRPLLDKVPGVGEVQLAQVENPQNLGAYSSITSSRVKYLMDKLTDSDIQDAINDAWAQSAVWNDSTKGGFVYEVFVRAESIDTDSMLMKYKFVAGTRE